LQHRINRQLRHIDRRQKARRFKGKMIDAQQIWEECRPVVEESGFAPGHFKDSLFGLRDTLPKILVANYRSAADTVCMRKKEFGIWRSYTWAEVYRNVKCMALGLKHLGVESGAKISIIGDNDPEWYWAELCTQAIGAACVGLFIDAMPSDIDYVANDSDSVIVFAKDQEQTDKFLEIRDKLPQVRRVIYWDDKGMAHAKDNPWLMRLADLIDAGRQYEIEHPTLFDDVVAHGTSGDIAVLCYTSGTTSLPKGVMLSHEYLIKSAIRWGTAVMPQDGDNYLSYVPPAWIAEQLQVAACSIFRTKVNFPEKPETIMENLREIGPQTALLSPMQWQSIYSQVQMKILDTGFIRRFLYRLCLPVGYKVAAFIVDFDRSLPWHWRVMSFLAEWVCFHHMRDYLGLSRLRYGITGGAALGPDVFRWFIAIGARIKDGYGLTELTPATIHQRRIIPGTSGQPLPGVEVRIGEEGEIQIRSDVAFKGYYKKESATKDMFSEDGWIKTGDCGGISPNGHLIVYDRMKEMLPLKGGEHYSPTYIQNRLKFSPYIKEVLAVGGEDRESILAIVTIDFDNVGRWAEKNRITYTTFVDLSQKDDVYDLVHKEVLRVNETLPPNVRIGRYTLLHKEFDADESELTRTRKLRRAFLEQKYAELISAAYDDKNRITIQADVKYRDGRQGTIRTDLQIRKV